MSSSDAHGIALAATVTDGKRNDVTQLLPLIRAVPPIRGKGGRPRRRPNVVHADRGYDHDKYRRQLRDWASAPPSPAEEPGTATFGPEKLVVKLIMAACPCQ